MKYRSIVALGRGGPEVLRIVENDLRPPAPSEARVVGTMVLVAGRSALAAGSVFGAVSDVPALLLSGEFDSGTPPAFGEAVAAYLSRGRHVVLPGLGHCEVYASACMAELQLRFFDDPWREPDASCVKRMPAFAFSTTK